MRKEDRPSFQSIYMNFALSLEKRSTCERKQVGCVVVSEDFQHVLGIGYNGNIPGGQNRCEDPKAASNCGCEHAESNALLKVNVDSNTPKILFTTWSPCRSCAKKILIKQGIKHVYYCRRYKDLSSLQLLEYNGVETSQVGVQVTFHIKDKGIVDCAAGDDVHQHLNELYHRLDGPAIEEDAVAYGSFPNHYYIDGVAYELVDYMRIIKEVKNMSPAERLTDPRWWVREYK
jgi:dCMP deaminase